MLEIMGILWGGPSVQVFLGGRGGYRTNAGVELMKKFRVFLSLGCACIGRIPSSKLFGITARLTLDTVKQIQ